MTQGTTRRERTAEQELRWRAGVLLVCDLLELELFRIIREADAIYAQSLRCRSRGPVR